MLQTSAGRLLETQHKTKEKQLQDNIAALEEERKNAGADQAAIRTKLSSEYAKLNDLQATWRALSEKRDEELTALLRYMNTITKQ